MASLTQPVALDAMAQFVQAKRQDRNVLGQGERAQDVGLGHVGRALHLDALQAEAERGHEAGERREVDRRLGRGGERGMRGAGAVVAGEDETGGRAAQDHHGADDQGQARAEAGALGLGSLGGCLGVSPARTRLDSAGRRRVG